MIRNFSIYIWLLIASLVLDSCSTTKELNTSTEKQKHSLLDQLKALPNVVEVNLMNPEDHFTEQYELWFEQLTDPANRMSPTFKQRVILAHSSLDAPVIVELEGYKIHSNHAGELATLFHGNQITIEHRYFEKSIPIAGIPWKTLTIRNAAADQHTIIETLKRAIYPKNQFISTGISKGGQTAMIHRSLYPDDVNASVCYVAPLNFEREDPRIWDFLESVGTEDQRTKIRDFQLYCFKRKSRLVSILKERALSNDYKWNMEIDVAFDYYLLEYSFAFWQWGHSFDEIPAVGTNDEEILDHILTVSGLSFFEKTGVEKQLPFFYAAMTEMGMYNYDTRPFVKYLSQEKYDFEFSVDGLPKTRYDSGKMLAVNSFIQNKAEKMLFIYGELDPWSATAVELSEQAKARGLNKYVLKGGYHDTRIRNFPDAEKKEILELLNAWIGTATRE